MTPLAQKVTKQLLLRTSERTIKDDCSLLASMADVHHFEVSQVLSSIHAVHDAMAAKDLIVGRFAFLPAPRTWIEWREADVRRDLRIGVHLEAVTNSEVAPLARVRRVVSVVHEGFDVFLAEECGFLELSRGQDFAPDMRLQLFPETRTDDADRSWTVLLYTILAFVNSPKIIGRQQYSPHRGLERALLAQQKAIGRFPLHPWTEIKLEVAPPLDASGDGVQEARLTGQKAFHFCRAHLRIRNGQLERGRSHWRGDPALGIKQSRYTLVPQRQVS